ncbi:hypothetical protein SeMB42_g07889 [Synchytrium endobioticum]|uniref:Mitochondrial thiamine pyrophosphate carrier 1 n=1 Tax=Synchytrium endobioticum TaxID=286115 RepID=A0A507BX73_9FUNG|nr:hypothetical protein SeMB42_g07889 [Synchytrium endobioticum]TPX31691.1 hypothetical protein SeLEV6574_g08518 [Synchytrium endobioticum]
MLATAAPNALPEIHLKNGLPSTPVPDANPKLSSAELGACGATAGVISRFVIAPLDVIKIRFQLQTATASFLVLPTTTLSNPSSVDDLRQPKYRGITHAFRTILREEGIQGLWKGNMPAEYLYLTYGAVQFATYAKLDARMKDLDCRLGGSVISLQARTFICGALAGSLATMVTYPFDLLRTRFAVQGEKKLYRTVPGAIRHIYAREGITGFYRGVWPSALSIMPYMGIMFESHRWFKSVFQDVTITPILSKDQSQGLTEMLAGFSAGIVSKAAVMPFDVVRKLLQVQGPDRTVGYVVSNVPKYPRPWVACARIIIAQEGALGLYKGLLPSIMKAGPSAAVTFFVFDGCRAWLSERTQRHADSAFVKATS